MIMHWSQVYNLSAVALRFFNVYGPRSRTSGTYGAVFGVFLKQKLAGRPFTVVGNGRQKRDFIYVSDVANAFFLAAKTKLVGKIWNLGSGEPQSINRLVEILQGDVVYIPKRPSEPGCTYANITKIKKDLAWKPKIKFKRGVKMSKREKIKDTGREVKQAGKDLKAKVKRAFSDEEWAESERSHEKGKMIMGVTALGMGILACFAMAVADSDNNSISDIKESIEARTSEVFSGLFSSVPHEPRPDNF